MVGVHLGYTFNLTDMTRFEEHLKAIFEAYNGIEIDTEAATKIHAKTLLALAREEIEKENRVSATHLL